LELTTFKSPLVSRRSRSSPKPLPRIYIKKENLEHEEEESFAELCCPNIEELLHSTSVAVRFPSLVEELRRSKEKGERRSASTLRGNCIDVLLSFELIDHWFSPMNVCISCMNVQI
jgi:hypothetical protein